MPKVTIQGSGLILTALFMALAYPYRILFPIGPLNSFTLAEVALLLAWIILLLRQLMKAATYAEPPGYHQLKPRFKGMDVVILMYIGINFLSFLWAEDANFAIRGMVPILENAAFYYLIVLFASTRERLNHVIVLFLGLGVIALVLAAIFYFGQLNFLQIIPTEDQLLRTAIATRLGSPAWGASNYFASIMLLFLPTYLSFAALSRSGRGRLLFGAISATGLVIFSFTLSRGGYISVAVGILACFFLISRRKFSLRIVITTTILAFAFALGLSLAIRLFPNIDLAVTDLYERVLRFDDTEPNIQIRLYLFRIAWDIIKDNFWGLGVGNFAAVSEAAGLGIHNIYLQTMLETGWLGGVAFILMLALLLKQNWRLINVLKSTPYEPLAYGFLVAFFAILLNIAVEASFEGVIFGWIFWITQGLVRSLGRENLTLKESW